MGSPLHDHLALNRCDSDSARRCDAATELELHDDAHHARMREILGSIPELDGEGLLRRAARSAFGTALDRVLEGIGDEGHRIALTEAYYAYLGLGMVWLDAVEQGVVHAPVSHVALAWSRRSAAEPACVCALVEGFIEAALHRITGRTAEVRELECVAAGAQRCRFAIAWCEPSELPQRDEPSRPRSTSITPATFVGDVDGLICVDGQQLAHVPASLYAQALADWLAAAARRGTPTLAHALTQLDQVSAPEGAPLRLVAG